MKRIVGLYIAWLIATVMLAVAVARSALVRASYAARSHHYYRSGHNSHASDFYTLLRWVCCAAFAYSAVTAFQMKRVSWTWIFGVLAVLFNPIAPVYLQRDTWQVIDCVAIALMFIAAVVFWRGNKQSSEHRL